MCPKILLQDVYCNIVYSSRKYLETILMSTTGRLVKLMMVQSYNGILCSHLNIVKTYLLTWKDVHESLLSGKKTVTKQPVQYDLIFYLKKCIHEYIHCRDDFTTGTCKTGLYAVSFALW